MASDKNSGQIRLIKDLIREAIEEKYSILLERPGRSNLINEVCLTRVSLKWSLQPADQAAVNLF